MGNFMFHGVDTVKLAEKYGTPLYVMSEDFIKERCKEIRDDFLNKHSNTKAVYASKAFLTKEMARIIKREGLGIDVVSGGELYTAIEVDFPMDKVILHGNNKSVEEIEMAVQHDVGRIVVDNISELDLVQAAGEKFDKIVKILFRISPGIESDTHRYIQTGQVDSKFGIPLNKNSIKKAMEKANSLKNVELLGFHSHIGSQIFDNENHIKSIEVITNLMKDVKRDFGFITKELNTGGGYGIQYAGDDERKPLSYFTDEIVKEVEKRTEEYGLERPTIIIEPGRWVAGEAGITLYTVGSIKEIPGVRTYVGIDGGMPDNPRPSLYQAEYDAVVANKINEEKTDLVTIAGKCCESGDILIWDLQVPELESGDILAVLATGAYNYSMSSNYNKLRRPAVVMINEGEDRVIVERETYQDLLRNQV